MEKLIEEIIDQNRKFVDEAKVADYIPALKKANVNDIGVCIIGNEEIYKLGDYNRKFTIQSISKVFTLALALIDNGKDYVFNRIGFMGTDEPFNTIYKLGLDATKYPANSMINAGAILTTSLVKKTNQDPIDRIIQFIKYITNNDDIKINEEVYLSEKETGDRNKAMAYLMKANDMISKDVNVEELLDTYFKQCSLEIDSIDLAKLAFFIADGCNGLDDYGKTNKEELTKILLSEMLACGMYNYSCEYLLRVGIPSKSGVGGGIMASSKGKYGIGVYSPGLDENGNSKVGVEILEDLSKELDLSVI